MIFLKRLFVEENTFSYNKPDYNPQYIFIRKKIILRIWSLGNSLAVQWLGLGGFMPGPGSIPGQEAKIPQAMLGCQKKKHKRMQSLTGLSVYHHNTAVNSPESYNVYQLHFLTAQVTYSSNYVCLWSHHHPLRLRQLTDTYFYKD